MLCRFQPLTDKIGVLVHKEVDLLITWLFNLTQSYYNYKMASTIGIIVFILCAVFTLIAFSRFLKGDREEAFR